ncbi:MAG: DNA mismatch repair endonuclease MutL, partial [Nitrospira sp.]|nr:DNA mismatch repair endonuclease MutL [Nitrospira sp.]
MLTTDGRGKICILPEEVIGRIAAGEVVERPAAVVKELLENSIDAGSRAITIDVKDGGLSLIRVTDDGEGMSREDAPRAFYRHATSKLQSDVDLWSIRTMGFRGEALPSIAAVAQVRLRTATPLAEVGTELEVVDGLVGKIADAPPVTGTRIEVAALFHNQPARKKFLKSIATECSHITRVVQQAALAWPSIQFRLTHNAQEMMNYPAVSSAMDRIAQVYRPVFLDQCLSIQAALPGVAINGYIVDAIYAKSS